MQRKTRSILAGADDSAGPLKRIGFAVVFRKIAAFCGRTETSAPTRKAECLYHGTTQKLFDSSWAAGGSLPTLCAQIKRRRRKRRLELLDEFVDGLTQIVQRLLVVVLHGVHKTVLDMILQNDLADVVDGGAHGGDLD